MNSLISTNTQLPDTIEELSSFVFVGREKLTALKAAIRACNKSELISDKLNQMKEEEQLLAENVLIAETRIGELLKDVPKDNPNKRIPTGGKSSAEKDLGISKSTAQRYQVLAKHPDLVEEAIKEARKNDRPVRRADVINRIPVQRETERTKLKQAREEHQTFKEQKDSDVIGFKEAVNDKKNLSLMSKDLEAEIARTMKGIRYLGRFRNVKETKELINTMSKDTRRSLAEQISEATSILCYIGRELINGK